MRLPRDVSGQQLIRALKSLGYETISPEATFRLTTVANGEHHLTIPNHDPIKIGTLVSILDDVAGHFEISRPNLILKIGL